MKNRTCTLVLAAALAAGSAPAHAAASREAAGIVVAVEGAPEYMAPGAATKALKLTQTVYQGDTIRTGRNDRAAVAFTGGAEVRISGGSTFKVEAGGHKPVQLYTRLGKMWSRMIGAGGKLSVRTPAAVAAVRGTEADIDMQDNLTVKVYEGHVDVQNQQGMQSVAAGQMTTASAGSAPDAPRQMREGDKESWQNGIEVIDATKQLEKLQKQASNRKTVEVIGPDGKKTKIELQKK